MKVMYASLNEVLIILSTPVSVFLGSVYMVVDCGGGTVDITVHEVSNTQGNIREVFKATGGPYGSVSKSIH